MSGSPAGPSGRATDAELELARILATRSWRWTRPLRRIVPRGAAGRPPTEGVTVAPRRGASPERRSAARRALRVLILRVWDAYRVNVPARVRRAVPAALRSPVERRLKALTRAGAAQVRVRVTPEVGAASAAPDGGTDGRDDGADDPSYDRHHERLVGRPTTWKPAKVVAFHLPQYHRIPENDRWWGEGFTDWVNVSAARPLFRGHHQPRVPLREPLGAYDLTDPAVLRRQAELARSAGVHAFCFYFYWFAGRRLLEGPLLGLLDDPEFDLPFCVMWANERWARTWDGYGDRVLIDSDPDDDDHRAMFEHLGRYFRDPRHLTVRDRPVLGLYRLDGLPSVRRFRAIADEAARDAGRPGVHLFGALTHGNRRAAGGGLDALVQFPPHNLGSDPRVFPEDPEWPAVPDEFSGRVYHYGRMAAEALRVARSTPRVWPTVTLGWDNTARRGSEATVTVEYGLDRYRDWLRSAIHAVREDRTLAPDEQFVFVNAWNEWAEGAYLEPDVVHGFGALQATRDALADVEGDRPAVIVLVHDLWPYGAERLALSLVSVLQRRLGVHVEVVALSGGSMRAEFAALAPIHVLDEPAGPAARDLLADLRERGCRSAIVNSVASAPMLPLLEELGVRTVALVHEFPGELAALGLLEAAEHVRRLASVVVFPAQAVRERFEAASGPLRVQGLVRPQGLYRAARLRRSGAADGEAFRTRLGIAEGVQVVLGVGAGVHRKGLDVFVETVGRLSADEVVGVWVGRVDEAMRDWIAGHDVPRGGARTILAGESEDVGAAFRAADLLFVSSREDPFPTVVLEALQTGVPVAVIAGCTGSEDLLIDEDLGRALAGSTDEIASGLVDLLRDGALRRRVAERGPTLVRERFDECHYARDVLALLGHASPRVSVVVPSYQHATYLGARLGSVLAQTVEPFEVILVDDGSTDGSIDALRGWAARTEIAVRFLGPERARLGPVGSWLRGVEVARGEFVWIAESDDESDPCFLERLLERIRTTGSDHGFTDSAAIAPDSSVLLPSYACSAAFDAGFDRSWRRDLVLAGPADVARRLLPSNPIMNVSACLFAREPLLAALRRVAPHRARFGAAADWVVYAELVAAGSMAYLAEPLNRHRRNPAGLVATEVAAGSHEDLLETARAAVRGLANPDGAQRAASDA